MPKFMYKANYTNEGLAGLLEEGGTGRRQAVEAVAASVGGRVESMYYAFGETDVYVIVDVPDEETAAATSLKIAATGTVTVETVKLLEPEQIDAAVGREVDYRPPGR